MNALTQFRDHCRRMADAEHKPECPSLAPRVLCGPVPEGTPPPPACHGCMSDTDRALFAQMAGEVDDYIDPQADLFGDVRPEPEAVEA